MSNNKKKQAKSQPEQHKDTPFNLININYQGARTNLFVALYCIL